MNNNEDFDYVSIYNKSVKFISIVSLVLTILFYRNLSYTLGFLLGGAACLFNYHLMVRSFAGMFSKTNYSRRFANGYSLRFIIVAIVLAAAINLKSFNLFTTVIGILTVNIIITWSAISKYLKSNMKLE